MLTKKMTKAEVCRDSSNTSRDSEVDKTQLLLPLLDDQEEPLEYGNSHNKLCTQRNLNMKEMFYLVSVSSTTGCSLLAVTNPNSGVHTEVSGSPSKNMPVKSQVRKPKLQLWLASVENLEDRVLLLTLDGVDLNLLKRRIANKLVAATIRHHEWHSHYCLDKSEDLSLFIVATQNF